MAPQSRRLAGILLIFIPAVAFGGASLLSMILAQAPGYLDNPVRQDLWRAGHAHAGIMLILSLVLLRYVDETRLEGGWLWLARHGVPVAAILMPAGFFLSVLTPDQTAPNALIALVAVGGLFLVGGVLSTGVGLLRVPRGAEEPGPRSRS
jgi:peptidoglycan/LPS O-acetylase OafA/YrhL